MANSIFFIAFQILVPKENRIKNPLIIYLFSYIVWHITTLRCLSTWLEKSDSNIQLYLEVERMARQNEIRSVLFMEAK